MPDDFATPPADPVTKREYAQRDTEALGEHYLRHVKAMTAEGLHRKNDIAAELACRDQLIEQQRAALAALHTATPTADEAKMIESVREVARLESRATKPPWEWHTSNSWRRLKRDAPGIMENVIEPYVVRHDNHPDLLIKQQDMDFIAAARNLDWPAIVADCRIADAARAYVEADDDLDAAIESRDHGASCIAADARGAALEALSDAVNG